MTKHDQKHELIKAVLLATSVGTSVFSIGLAYAGGPITQLNTSTTGATLQTYTGSDANTYNWGQGTDVHFDGFQFSGNSYVPVFLADDVTIRRVDATTTPANGNIKANGLACGIFAESTSDSFNNPPFNLSPPFNLTTTYPEDSVGNGNCDMEAMVGGDIISRGGLDVFDNDDDVGPYKKAKNIERVDFIFTGGITAPALVSNLAESGHIVTEKSGNNPVQIAAILSLDGTGNPASYGTLLTVDQSSNSPDVAYGLYNSIARTHFEFLSNDPLAATKVFPTHIQFSNEFLGSAFVTLDQLGVGAGVTYFGFSYFPADVDTASGHILTDPSTFPSDTAGNNGDADMYGGTSGYFTLSTLANQTPVAVDDTASTSQNTNITIDVLFNDSDSDPGDILTLSIDTQPTNGTATVNDSGTPGNPADDTIDYLPNANFIGTDTFVYQIDDGNAANGGDSNDTATVTVTVTAIVLDAVDDPVTTQMDTPIDIDVLANDNSSNPVTLTTATAPTNGTAVVDDKGTPALTDDTIDYTPNTGFIGQDTFTYQIDDGSGTDIATVTVIINGQPTATNDAAGTSQNNPVTINVLTNDSDPDNNPLAVSITTAPTNGNAVVNGDETITYTPNAGFTGTDTLVYQVDDGNNGTTTATVTITVGDSDGDGITDDIDIDDDNDGIPDSVEGPGDLDGDGIPNIRDLDSDGDGILDLAESGLSTTEIATLDTDGDGQIDSGNNFGPNGLADPVETTPEAGTVDYDNDGTADNPANHDTDTQPDFLDLDSDNDGVTDAIEAGQPDSNGDGLADAGHTPALTTPDSDGDGIADVHDLDSDNDGVTDTNEASLSDTNGDGLVDGFTDADGDGYDDAVAAIPAALPDTDNDGIRDILDLDSDNDGVTDTTEAGLSDTNGDGIIDGFTDADGDGYDDATTTTPAPLPDTDNDGIADILDLDSDNDGITDTIEAGLSDTDGDGHIDGFTDADGDGYDDAVTAAPATPLRDTDNDGVPDIHDLDSDNDGITDTIEAGLSDTDGDGHIDGFTDADGDGYDDAVTTTPPSPLPDTDNDGVPDVHDLDSDNDGITDTTEAGLSDGDNDGRIDNFTDVDGDGYDDSVAAAPPTPLPDTDADNTPDVHDLDSDNDGDTDTNEAGLSDTNNDGLIDGFTDSNGDGYDDNLQGLNPTGKVRTGLDAVGGCAIDTDAKFDPMMPLLMLFALLYLLRNATVSGQRPVVVARRALSASILGIAAMSASTASTAQEEQDEFKSGLYVGAGIGFSHVKPDTDKTAFEVDEEIDLGWKVFLGYDYSKRISFEAHYADLGEATLKPQGSVDYSVYGLSGLYRFGQKGDNENNDLFTRQGMSYYGKVGVGKMENEGNDVDFHRVNDVHVFFGLGAEYGYKNGIAIRLEADLYDEDAQLYSINLVKRFKKRSRRVVSNSFAEAEPVSAPAQEVAAAPVALVAAIDCQASINTILSSGSIHFRTNRADLAPQSHALLNELADMSNQCADAQIEIGGHTDSRGKASYNMNLSQQRAETVLRYLQAASVSADRLSAVGYGETQPVADNATREGRAKNRRIEFTVK